ncbi:GAF sensor signal transduction histidine kinase [[Leptolyngbya] sp. PCC 7376]|uniref:GAF domain-containing sensor histidine kinase n=1 Tax=[Leptolyngbya] sp. PCC 7376 TaxID=111781 RepID=UPI00029F2239|nr:GAF domain-containing sensor histidine kinase [[Leptolyngbya] sp. PCC 7376]AFY37476.1 GAF sensor signal transduction histidine kinase [[Leptolyngbya] sp. PCC 7376]
MLVPAPLPNESERLATLHRYDILDTPAEAAFDEIAAMAAELCNTPIALVSLVDQKRQWFKACIGLDAKETPREISFCGHAIHQDDILEVPDASKDPRFADNPLVTGAPYIRLYAGKPLRGFDGNKLGTLCIIAPEPRTLTKQERKILVFLGTQVERQLALRLALQQSTQSLKLIQSQAKQLEAGNKIRTELISVLAHDLRSPLSSIEGIVEAFDQDLLDEDQLKALMQTLRPDLARTSNQLTHVLQWIQQQMDAEKAPFIPFSIEAIATQTLDWVKQRAFDKQVILSADLEPDLWGIGQPELVNIVWRNLLCNAIKYSNRQDKVTLFASHDENEIVLGVKDTGLGINPETLQALRNHQRQASTKGTANEIGTGIGLMLCRTYLQKMGSTLKIDSELSKGSTFSFRLPIDHNKGQSNRPKASD